MWGVFFIVTTKRRLKTLRVYKQCKTLQIHNNNKVRNWNEKNYKLLTLVIQDNEHVEKLHNEHENINTGINVVKKSWAFGYSTTLSVNAFVYMQRTDYSLSNWPDRLANDLWLGLSYYWHTTSVNLLSRTLPPRKCVVT